MVREGAGNRACRDPLIFLKMDTKCSSETSVTFCETKRRYVTEISRFLRYRGEYKLHNRIVESSKQKQSHVVASQDRDAMKTV
jgi:hypothetical protein